MYPDHPTSAADLVPLPLCDGPKLKAFDFQGQQKIEFLEYLGLGSHSYVFKVKILGQIYALKLFRFVDSGDWQGAQDDIDDKDPESMGAFYDYSEPFNCECRAYGRLQESGHEDLAVKCFGYILLDDDHERMLMGQFGDAKLEYPLDFDGSTGEYSGGIRMRSIHLGRDGRPQPIRGIVKEFGARDQDLRDRGVRRLLRATRQLQQLGIFSLDMRNDQIISGKLTDFSMAITVPHFMTSPELNPHLTPEWISAMAFETFQHSLCDYRYIDEMVLSWNYDHPKNQLSVLAVPAGHRGTHVKYNLRSTPSRDRPYTFVDPRLWDAGCRAARNGATRAAGRRNQGRGAGAKVIDGGKRTGSISKARWRLDAWPARWHFDCDNRQLQMLGYLVHFRSSLVWTYRDGFLFPSWVE